MLEGVLQPSSVLLCEVESGSGVARASRLNVRLADKTLASLLLQVSKQHCCPTIVAFSPIKHINLENAEIVVSVNAESSVFARGRVRVALT